MQRVNMAALCWPQVAWPHPVCSINTRLV